MQFPFQLAEKKGAVSSAVRWGGYVLALWLAFSGVEGGQTPAGLPACASAPAELVRQHADDASTSLLTVSVAGSPQEMGFAQGSALREEIRTAVSQALQRCAGIAGGWEDCRRRAEGLERALPEALDAELSGLAAGAGVSERDLLVLNLLAGDGQPVGDDSVYAAWGTAALEQEAFLAGVWKWDGALGQPIWLVRRPAGGMPTALLASPGWLGGLLGMNEGQLSGLALSLRTGDATSAGLTPALALRAALEGATQPADATAQVMGLPHAGGGQVWFVSPTEEGDGVEFSAHAQRRLEAVEHTFSSVGLYLDSNLALTQVSQQPAEVRAAWQLRAEAAQQMLRVNGGWISAEKMLAFVQGSGQDEPAWLRVLLAPEAGDVWLQPNAGRVLLFSALAHAGDAPTS